jgi:hypothetical protein
MARRDGPGERTPALQASANSSDGVFAIAITLLVLELRPPESAGAFAHDLVGEWPTYLAYVAAFVMIGSVWLHHHGRAVRTPVSRRIGGVCRALHLLQAASRAARRGPSARTPFRRHRRGELACTPADHVLERRQAQRASARSTGGESIHA